MQWKVLNKYEGTQFSGLLISAIRRDWKILKRRRQNFSVLTNLAFFHMLHVSRLK